MVIVTSYISTAGQPRIAEVQAFTGSELVKNLTSTQITPARAWIDSTGKITSTGTYSNTSFENTKMKTIDGDKGTHADIPGGWGASSGGYQTLGITYDLGAVKSITDINVSGIAASTYYISGVRVFVSQTGNDWVGKTAVVVDETNDNIGKVEFGGTLSQAVSARYVMIIVTNYISTAGQPRIAEVSILGSTSTGGTTTTYPIANIIGNLKLNGRTTSLSGNLANGLDLDWSSSGVSFNMAAAATTDVTFNFSMYSRSSVDPSVYFTIHVDGTELTNKRYGMKASAANARENLSLKIEGLTAGNHLIEIFKQTENKSGECTLLSIAMNGTFGTKPANKSLKMEMIGDSVIAGYGNLGTKAINTDSVGSSPLYQDALKTFGALTAKRLNADFSVLGMSGIAVACGSTDTAHYYIMPDYYLYSNAARYSPKYYTGSWINWNFGSGSNVVIINLGSNDWNRHKTVINGQEVWNESSACGVSYQEVGEYMIAFLRTVRANNPNAHIVWTYGMTGYASRDKVQMAVNTLKAEGDTKVSYLDLQTGADGVDGANGHPSVAEHTTASNTLYNYLNNLLN